MMGGIEVSVRQDLVGVDGHRNRVLVLRREFAVGGNHGPAEDTTKAVADEVCNSTLLPPSSRSTQAGTTPLYVRTVSSPTGEAAVEVVTTNEL